MSQEIAPITSDVTTSTGDEPDDTLVPEGAASYPYIHLAQRVMAGAGQEIPIPSGMTRIFAAMCIPNEHGQSMGGHTEQVRKLSTGLAEGLNRCSPALAVPDDVMRILKVCTTLHDIGKTGPAPDINSEPEQFIFYYNLNFPAGEARSAMLVDDLDKAVMSGKLLPYTRDYMISTLIKAGYDPYKMTRRDLYTTHLGFTDDIAGHFGFSRDIRGGSAMHHSKKGLTTNGYKTRDFLHISRVTEPADEAGGMSREGNDNSRLGIRETAQAIFIPFESISDRAVSQAYCATLSAAFAHDIFQNILKENRRPEF
jgi:hypothetical protein